MNTRALFSLALAKSGFYSLEGLLIPFAQAIAQRELPRIPLLEDPALFLRARKMLNDLLWKDAERISSGVYPASVLVSPHPVEDSLAHLQRLPRLFRDAVQFQKRKAAKATKKFSAEASENAKGAPPYYVRNFHFQEDGYLSAKSAAIYDHQVELLFAGSADAMRRLVIAPIKNHFPKNRKLRILELACGTGSTTRFLSLAFPDAEITAIDLSEPYLDEARKREECRAVKFRAANAEKLPFKAKEFDVVTSVFLFHELPMEARERVLAEAKRVLKPNGILSVADSLQLGDAPEVDGALLRFPREFHEPYYPNYIRNPLEELLRQQGFAVKGSEVGFFTKACAAVPAAKRKN